MEIHDDYQTAPNLNISMGCVLAQLIIRGCCVWQQSEVGRVGQKAVNSSGAKPESAVLCWLVVRFVAVITVIN